MTKNTEKPKKKILKPILFSLIGLFLCVNIALFISAIIIENNFISVKPEIEYPDLPQLYITLNNTTLEEINTNPKTIKYPNNNATFLVDKEYYDFENVEIKGRGNSTWNDSEKKPYQIKFNEKQNLFGLGKAKSWILLANHFDPSQIRNDTALYLARLLGLEYINDGKFIELYINDEYIGLYYLTQKVALSSASVKIKNPYAVLMELDNIYYAQEEKQYVTQNGDIFVLKDSISEDEAEIELATNDFVDSFSSLEIAIKEKNWAKIETLIDVDSFVKFYLVQDFSLNWDAFTTSNFFYKDGIGDKIHAGPIWDFDNSFENWLETAFYRRSIQYKGLSPRVQSYTFFELAKLPEFRTKLKENVEKYILPNANNLIERITSLSESINGAVLKDNEKWQRSDYYSDLLKVQKAIEKRINYYTVFYANEEEIKDGIYLFTNLSQEYKIERLPIGTYKISRLSDGRVLGADESYEEYGTTSFHAYTGSDWQQWRICRDNEGKYYLFSYATESVLTIDQDGILKTKPFTRSESEQFEIAEIGIFPLDTLNQKFEFER